MRTLHIDCTCGITGRALLAGMLDLLATQTAVATPAQQLERVFQQAGIALRISYRQATVGPLSGVMADSKALNTPEAYDIHQLLDAIAALPLSLAVQERTASTLMRFAETCGDASPSPDVIKLVTSIAGTFWGLERLGVQRVTCSAIPLFSGSTKHNGYTVPLPAQATLQRLTGKPVFPTNVMQELVTPSGALLLDAIVHCFTDGTDNPNALLPPPRTLPDSSLSSRTSCPHTSSPRTSSPHTSSPHTSGEAPQPDYQGTLLATSTAFATPPTQTSSKIFHGLRLMLMDCPHSINDVASDMEAGTSATEREKIFNSCPACSNDLDKRNASAGNDTGTPAGETSITDEEAALQAFALKTGRSLSEVRAMLFGEEDQ